VVVRLALLTAPCMDCAGPGRPIVLAMSLAAFSSPAPVDSGVCGWYWGTFCFCLAVRIKLSLCVIQVVC
jgi:hypothetical protein